MAMSALKSLMMSDGLEIVVADSDPLAPGLHFGFKSFLLPSIEDERFFPCLEEMLVTENVDVFIPCLDTFLIPVARNRSRLERLGVKVMISPEESIELSRDKWKMYERLKGKVPMPYSWVDAGEIPDAEFPLFVKPRDGSGSINAYRVDSREELIFYMERLDNMIIQEYLPGREFTVDCITDLDGNLIASSPRERIKTKAGICTISRTVDYPELDEIAEMIAKEIDMSGPFFFQVKEDKEGKPKVTELNIRLAGTMALTTEAGVNIPLLATMMLLGEDVKTDLKPKKGLYLARYWEEVYLTDEQINSKRSIEVQLTR